AGDQPGLFFYIEPPRLVAAVEKGLGGPRRGVGKGEMEALAAVKDLVNFKAFRAAGYGLSLDKGTFRYPKLVLLDPKETSPLLDLMPSKPVQQDLFRFTPDDAVFAAALPNDNGRERWANALKLIDSLARLGGKNAQVPSEEVAKMEKALGI